MTLNIDRCICRNHPFAELKRIARAHGARTLDDLWEHAEFGDGCRLCRPYVRRMLETGETVFHRIIADEDESD